ncbi:MAG: acyl-ACP--UDP-N-acetylglucosamine O-acyltransferase [Gammaproteobacteria bacterium]|jgi:UDP-N-acetylglucosamine acyltransferase|tara:strand:- start:3691 stop:4461 length:771 start_codon:yes stop_codon:yes gene_type:complete
MIHPSAIIDKSAKLDIDVTVGPYSVIGADVEIKSGSVIGSHVLIEGPSLIGKQNKIFSFATIGGDPQDKKYDGEKTYLEIGDNNIFREGVTVNRGTAQENSKTIIGSGNLFMAYVHVAHDCIIEDDVVMVNNSAIAGCVRLEKGVILGGFSLIHQFCNIGAYSFSAMGSAVSKDVPAFVRVSGNPAKARGLNTTGIARLNMTKESSKSLKEAYKILYMRKIPLDEARKEIKKSFNHIPEINLLLDSIKISERGIIR